MTREIGTVCAPWRAAGGYTFLRPDGDDTDLFCHASALEDCDELQRDQRVSFERGTDKRGRSCAVAVRRESA
jgi:cold shock CspA family protein